MSDGGPDAELIILLLVAVVTVVCAAYTLLMFVLILRSHKRVYLPTNGATRS
jgi:type II secretory pathway component PulK